MKLDWMKEVDWEEGLTEDLRMVLSACGEDAVFALLDRLLGHRLYVSSAPIRNAQRKYVQKFAGQKSARSLALQIGAPVSFVQRVLSEENDDDQD